jgi:hypothetical protein
MSGGRTADACANLPALALATSGCSTSSGSIGGGWLLLSAGVKPRRAVLVLRRRRYSAPVSGPHCLAWAAAAAAADLAGSGLWEDEAVATGAVGTGAGLAGTGVGGVAVDTVTADGGPVVAAPAEPAPGLGDVTLASCMLGVLAALGAGVGVVAGGVVDGGVVGPGVAAGGVTICPPDRAVGPLGCFAGRAAWFAGDKEVTAPRVPAMATRPAATVTRVRREARVRSEPLRGRKATTVAPPPAAAPAPTGSRSNPRRR